MSIRLCRQPQTQVRLCNSFALDYIMTISEEIFVPLLKFSLREPVFCWSLSRPALLFEPQMALTAAVLISQLRIEF